MNKKNELISIIIPCYNSGRTINRTIDSIKKQTWIKKEIIVVNDGSNDDYTLQKLQEIDGLLIINQTNLGLSTARNVGAYKARGTFLFFIDADDWIEDNALELMYKCLIRNGKDNYVYTDIFLEGNIRKIVRKNYNFFEQLFLNQIPYAILISKNTWLKIKVMMKI
ncbi:MAG: glycosyltransferase family 2 protein [Prochlorococcus marinus subsp. pastoris]